MNRGNYYNVIQFNIIFKITAIAILYPILLLIGRGMLWCARINYLTNQMISSFMLKPTTWIGVLIILMVLFLVMLMENFCMIAGYETLHGVDTNKSYMLEYGWTAFKRTFKFSNVWAVFINGAVIAAMNFVIFYNLVINVLSINHGLVPYVKKHWITTAFVSILILGLLVFVVMGYYTIQYMYHDEDSFWVAFKKSVGLAQKKKWSIIFTIFLYNLILLAIIVVLYLLVSLAVVVIVKVYGLERGATALYLTILRYYTATLNITGILISVPVSECIVEKMFYKHQSKIYEQKPTVNKCYRGYLKYIIGLAFVLDCIYLGVALSGKYFRTMDFLDVTEITAHRGCSEVYPENTMAAFQEAVIQMADSIELDVRQTKDGKFVVMHDENLMRMTGINRKVGTMTQEEICKLKVIGDYTYQDEEIKVPSFEEVLEFAKQNNVKLNIEIKTAKTDHNYVLAFYRTLMAHDMMRNCVVTSMDYNALKELKSVDSRIYTGYILSVGVGKYYDMEDVDFFSVNSKFVTVNMIYTLHAKNKEIHIWTLNRDADILRYASLGADNIITDNPLLAREVIYAKDTPDILNNVMDYVFGN